MQEFRKGHHYHITGNQRPFSLSLSVLNTNIVLELKIPLKSHFARALSVVAGKPKGIHNKSSNSLAEAIHPHSH